MKKFISASLLALLLFVFLPTIASAGAITGSATIGSPVANISIGTMNTATFIGVPSFTVITPGTGDFVTSVGTTGTALNITGNSPLPSFIKFNGFTVDVTSWGSGPNVWTLTPLSGGMDFLGLGFTGVISGNGFDSTAVVGSISATYSTGYGSDKVVGWSGNIYADGQVVPEPGTYAMLGLGLVVLGASKWRRKQTH